MSKLSDTIAHVILEVKRISENTCLWPGWDPMSTPMALYGTETAYLIGHPSPPENYEPLEPMAGRSVHKGPRMPEMAANTAWSIAGELCAMARIPDTPAPDIEGYMRLVIHECFHVHQVKSLSKAARPSFMLSNKYPEGDAENNALSIVENRLLAAAIQNLGLSAAKESEEQAKKSGRKSIQETVQEPDGKKALKDVVQLAASFLAVRACRHKRLESRALSDMCLYEQHSEFNEGAPTYIEVRAGRPVSSIVEGLHKANIGGEWAAMLRFYFTGAAIGLLLDRLDPDWHKTLAEGAGTMQSLLMKAVSSRDMLPAHRAATGEANLGLLPQVETVLENCGYNDILIAEQAHEASRQKQIASLFDTLQNGPGFTIQIEVPPNTTFIFNPSSMLGVNPTTKFHTCKFGIRAKCGAQVDIERLCLEEREKEVGQTQAADVSPDHSAPGLRAHVITVRIPEPPKITETGGVFHLSGQELSIKAPSAAVTEIEGGYYIRFQ